MLRKIFEPTKIGNMELKNRLIVSAMVTNFCDENGIATERYIRYHEAKAKGGWGLIITEDYGIDEHGKGYSNIAGLWNDQQIESHRKVTEGVHAQGGKIAAQIYHAGRQTGSHITGQIPIAPSPIKDPTMDETPHELEVSEIKEIIEKFGKAALRAKKAGFDAVEIHAGHGYLIGEFLSPFSNKRTDEYGGNIINRTRFAVEIIENVKQKVGRDFPILIKISADEFVDGGIKIEDAKVIAMLLEEAGVDAINSSFGVYASGMYNIAPSFVPHAFKVDLAGEIKKVVNIPVIAVGRINDPLIAEAVLLSGKADLIAMGRASLADPELPNKAKEGRLEDIQHCIGCVQGCAGRINKGYPISCVVNPFTGKERELKITMAEEKKKVLIAGGGISGMQAGIIAAQRGHEVHIFEKNDRLGGRWLLASIPPNKEELNTLTVWQKTQLQKLKVKVHLNTELTIDKVEMEKPDAVIVAIGASPIIPNMPGSDLPTVVLAQDILSGKREVGKNIVIVGGGLVGAETALHLANHGKNVTVIEKKDEIVSGSEPSEKYFLLKNLEKSKVNIITSTVVKEIRENSVVVEKDNDANNKLSHDSIIGYKINKNSAAEEMHYSGYNIIKPVTKNIEEKLNSDSIVEDIQYNGYHVSKFIIKEIKNIDNIVLATGSLAENTLKENLQGKVNEVIVIGDAIKARKAFEAVDEGYRAGLSV